MSEIKDGGPAFPTGLITNDKGVIVGGSNGISLRDYFAAKAMQALISDGLDDMTFGLWDAIPKQAYTMADAMLKARGQE